MGTLNFKISKIEPKVVSAVIAYRSFVVEKQWLRSFVTSSATMTSYQWRIDTTQRTASTLTDLLVTQSNSRNPHSITSTGMTPSFLTCDSPLLTSWVTTHEFAKFHLLHESIANFCCCSRWNVMECGEYLGKCYLRGFLFGRDHVFISISESRSNI